MGIHYDYKSKRGERAVLKQAKREARLAKKKGKKKKCGGRTNWRTDNARYPKAHYFRGFN